MAQKLCDEKSEYANKLIRQYVPKKPNFDDFNNQYLTDIQHKTNRRPRENLSFDSPKGNFQNNFRKTILGTSSHKLILNLAVINNR